jgi:hypothetical protein
MSCKKLYNFLFKKQKEEKEYEKNTNKQVGLEELEYLDHLEQLEKKHNILSEQVLTLENKFNHIVKKLEIEELDYIKVD